MHVFTCFEILSFFLFLSLSRSLFHLPGCSGMWDKVACWPSARVGKVVTIPCPKYFTYFTNHFHMGKTLTTCACLRVFECFRKTGSLKRWSHASYNNLLLWEDDQLELSCRNIKQFSTRCSRLLPVSPSVMTSNDAFSNHKKIGLLLNLVLYVVVSTPKRG